MVLSDSSDLSRKTEFVERDLSLEKPLKDIDLSKQTLPPSDWQSRLSNIAEPKFTAEKIDYGEIPEILSRKLPSTKDLTDSVVDDVFQDQGPGSMEIYKLDLSREKSLLTATAPSSKLPLQNKSKVPKKTNRLDTKTKITEIKSTTSSPENDYELSNFFKEQRTQVPVNRDAFDVGGVPELQVGCEGLEASSHKTKRSIGTSDKGREIPVAWLDVTPISLDLNYELSYDEEDYEEIDELLKLKRLETTARTIKPNRGDMDATLNNDHLNDFKRPEKLPIRGDLGESILANSSGPVNSPFRTNQNESWKLINSKVNYEEAKAKWKSISTDANDSISSHGRRQLSLAEVNTQDLVDKRRAKRSSDWGFGEDEGVVSSDELETVTERRRQHDMQFHRGATKYNHETPEMSSDDLRLQYQRLLEQRQRVEEARSRRTKQNNQGVLNKWIEEEERRREEMQRRNYEEYRRKTEYTSTPYMYDDEVQQQQIEEQPRQEATRTRNDQYSEEERRRRLQDEETRRRAQEIARRNEEVRRRQDEEERRRRLYKEEEMRRPHNRMQEEKRRQQQQEENARGLSRSRPVINEEDRQRPHDDEMRRREEERRRQEYARRQHEEAERRRLQNEETRRQEEYKLQQEAQRRREEEQRRQTDPASTLSTDDRRKLEERRREWSAKRRQEEEDERRRQTLNRNETPSNLIRMGNRVTSNDSKQYDADQDRRIREQQEREREQKLREYIARNRPININQPDRSSPEVNRRYRPEDNRDSRVNASREDEEYRRRLAEQHKRQEEERKLQDYIRRNQPVTVSPRNNQSNGRNWFEERRLIEETRRRGRYPDQVTMRRHGPSAPTNIDPRSSPEEDRRRQEEERRARERQQNYEKERQEELARSEEEKRRLLEERRKEATRREEEEERRTQARRYEEDRERQNALRVETERRRQDMLNERAKERENQIGGSRYPEATRSFYQDSRLGEYRRRPDSRPIPYNLVHDENQRTIERERQRQEYVRLEAEKRQQEENR